jgi:hypothetical protein
MGGLGTCPFNVIYRLQVLFQTPHCDYMELVSAASLLPFG